MPAIGKRPIIWIAISVAVATAGLPTAQGEPLPSELPELPPGYRMCAELTGAPVCADALALGLPVSLDVDADGAPDAVGKLGFTDLPHSQYIDRSLRLDVHRVGEVLPYHVYATVGELGVTLGIDGRSSSIPAHVRYVITPTSQSADLAWSATDAPDGWALTMAYTSPGSTFSLVMPDPGLESDAFLRRGGETLLRWRGPPMSTLHSVDLTPGSELDALLTRMPGEMTLEQIGPSLDYSASAPSLDLLLTGRVGNATLDAMRFQQIPRDMTARFDNDELTLSASESTMTVSGGFTTPKLSVESIAISQIPTSVSISFTHEKLIYTANAGTLDLRITGNTLSLNPADRTRFDGLHLRQVPGQVTFEFSGGGIDYSASGSTLDVEGQITRGEGTRPISLDVTNLGKDTSATWSDSSPYLDLTSTPPTSSIEIDYPLHKSFTGGPGGMIEGRIDAPNFRFEAHGVGRLYVEDGRRGTMRFGGKDAVNGSFTSVVADLGAGAVIKYKKCGLCPEKTATTIDTHRFAPPRQREGDIVGNRCDVTNLNKYWVTPRYLEPGHDGAVYINRKFTKIIVPATTPAKWTYWFFLAAPDELSDKVVREHVGEEAFGERECKVP